MWGGKAQPLQWLDYAPKDRGIGIRFLREARDFSLQHGVQSDWGIPQPSTHWAPSALSPAADRSGRRSARRKRNAGNIPIVAGERAPQVSSWEGCSLQRFARPSVRWKSLEVSRSVGSRSRASEDRVHIGLSSSTRISSNTEVHQWLLTI
jgi:hypothetical protein